MECFRNNLVLFTISAYLPGEYLLRVFPLVCKSMQSCRLSLSLLGEPTSAPDNNTSISDLEGEIYGIYSKWRDLQRILKRGHVITAFMMYKEFQSDLIFPYIVWLHITNYSHISFSQSFSFDRFPRLVKLEINYLPESRAVELLNELWRLPLTSLIISLGAVDGTESITCDHLGSPAFSQTLRLLQTNAMLFDLLVPHCQNLQSITTQTYHEMIAESVNLTSLELEGYSHKTTPAFNLTKQSQLVNLSLRGQRGFFSTETHRDMLRVSLEDPDPVSAKEFLARCPELQQLTLECDWVNIHRITLVLNPKICKRLKLCWSSHSTPPTFRAIETFILQRGFQINEEILLWTSDAKENWENIMEMAPRINTLTTFQEERTLEAFFSLPPPRDFSTALTSFTALSDIDIHSTFDWDQKMLKSFVKACSMLKHFKLSSGNFSGIVELDSPSLSKLDLEFPAVSGWNLRLPALTHLVLQLSSAGGEDTFLCGLLDHDPLIQLPLLRGLFIWMRRSENVPETPTLGASVSCKVGHQSLTQLEIIGRHEPLNFTNITLQNLPQLRKVTIYPLQVTTVVHFRVPGSSDIQISSRGSGYLREGCLNHPDVNITVHWDSEANRWTESNDEKRVRENSTEMITVPSTNNHINRAGMMGNKKYGNRKLKRQQYRRRRRAHR